MNRFFRPIFADSSGVAQIAHLSTGTSVAGGSQPTRQKGNIIFIDDFSNEIESASRILFLKVLELSDSCTNCWVDVRGQRIIQTKPQSWLQTFQTRLYSMRNLSDNWNGYGSAAPNREAFLNAEDVILVLHQKGLEPHRISPSAEEGIAFTFVNGRKRAIIECYNNGGISAAVFQKGMKSKVWTSGTSSNDLEETIDLIFTYLYA